MSAYPCTRKGWSKYYARRYNRTNSEQALHLAMWYDLLHLAFGD